MQGRTLLAGIVSGVAGALIAGGLVMALRALPESGATEELGRLLGLLIALCPACIATAFSWSAGGYGPVWMVAAALANGVLYFLVGVSIAWTWARGKRWIALAVAATVVIYWTLVLTLWHALITPP